MNRVVEILMHRDGLTQSEAEALIDECRQEMLGLEPDYVFDIL